MDREISKEVRQKEQRKQFIKLGAGIGIAVVLIGGVIGFMQTSLQRKDLVFSTVDKGVIEVSVSASGKVVPAFEEIINSPINSRIVEIYKKGGDSVDVGTPILKLDLLSAETDYKKQLDEEQMKRLQLDQLRIQNRNKLSEMEMQLKVSRMELNRKEVELRNERYLDSLGAGTTDKVRQVELDYNVSVLKLKEDEQKYENEKSLTDADYKVKELDLNIFRKSLAETKRTLEDAQIRSPRKAILTYVNNEVGAQVSQGSRVAIVSDLSHFKIEGEIADTYGDRIAAGSKAVVKIGNDKLDGVVSDVTPLSKNGVISFTVQLEEDNHRRLRSGLKTDVYVMNAVKEDVLRIANASYYVGRGEYDLVVDVSKDGFARRTNLGIVQGTLHFGKSFTEHIEIEFKNLQVSGCYLLFVGVLLFKLFQFKAGSIVAQFGLAHLVGRTGSKAVQILFIAKFHFHPGKFHFRHFDLHRHIAQFGLAVHFCLIELITFHFFFVQQLFIVGFRTLQVFIHAGPT